jgi:PleD family two-component response regulator
VLEGRVQPGYAVVLLAGGDRDLLLLRSAVLAAAGIWSMRVSNAEQAIQVLGFVPFDLVIICYTLEEAEQQRLVEALRSSSSTIKVTRVAPGDDCSGTAFLRMVEQALAPIFPQARVILEPPHARSRMIR